jgi:UDP-N-acetylglucosamine 1-carboxyvinyltransferase
MEITEAEKINTPASSASMSNSFEVTGGYSLKGEITPQGAKNEALQVICAVLLTDRKVVINNVPDIRDVNKLIELLQNMGVKVEKTAKSVFTFQADDVNTGFLSSPAFAKQAAALRGSIMIVGPLLARFGKATIPRPGGDKIGRRRLDTHFIGFQKLGANFDFDSEENFYTVEAKELKGSHMLLDEASVTGTANIIMAAVLAKGKTVIYNAACEPYIQQLCKMLNTMGARISGVGSNLLTIDGVDRLLGCEHTMLPDMIEIGSFIGLAAMTASEITIKNCGLSQLGIIPSVFQRLGIKMEFRNDDIFIPAQENYEIDTFIDGSILTIADAIWPGFTPDLLSVVLVTATQAKGTVMIHQKMFESRLFFVDKLIDMGAQIILCDPHRATVIGLNRTHHLKGIQMTSPDIRAGVALLIAALSAKGKSVIHNIEQIDRGYQEIDTRLNKLGAHIKRL